MRIGQAQVGEVLLSLHENEDPMLGIDVVPFLATSYAEARRLWAASKPAIEKKLASQGLMVLFAVPWPPQGIYSKTEINQVSDMRGLSWRVYNAATQRIAEIVGAAAVTIQAADLPQALATGLINAFMTSSATGYDSKAWEHMTYFYDRRPGSEERRRRERGGVRAARRAEPAGAAPGRCCRGGARLVAVAGQDQVVHGPAAQRLEGAAAEPT